MKRSPLFKLLVSVEPSASLRARVLSRLIELERTRARVRVALFSALSLMSAILLVPALQYAAQQFYASGFASYLSLIMSDRAMVLTYWREFAFALVESLPSIALLLVVPLFVALAWSVRNIARSAPKAFKALV